MEQITETRTCAWCSRQFSIFEGDLRFYEQFDVPIPSHCFDCRLQRRLAFYNRRKLYRRNCSLTGKPIISMFSPDKPFKVYDKDVWYSDAWNPLDYGRDFDFERSFFEQFREFMHEVPLLSRAVVAEHVNSDYTNDSSRLKNCYLVYDCGYGEGVLYAETFVHIKDSLDLLSAHHLELCYECVGCGNCYNLKYSRHCRNCFDAWFLRDCVGCKNCFGCANLSQKEYCIFNEQKSQAEYEEFIRNFKSGHYSTLLSMKQKVERFFDDLPVRATRGIQNTNVAGDMVSTSKNAFYCFNSNDLEDCRYCSDMLMGAKDCMDIHVWGDNQECCYNCCIVGENAFNVICSCFVGLGANDIAYSMFCTRGCSNLFGCIGLQRKRHCIFNKEYREDEYKALRAKIVAHMKETGEWGEFFPPELSLFGYNESLAPAYFPLLKDEVEERGWQWCDFETPLTATKTIAAEDLQQDINNVSDEILQYAILCETTRKPFKIVVSELNFYRKHQLPLPRRHPEQRHLDRFALKNSFQLWERTCTKCGIEVQSSYSPDRSEQIYCEDCYRELVF